MKFFYKKIMSTNSLNIFSYSQEWSEEQNKNIEQIKTINESIKMVQSKDLYFENLLLKIFLENKINKNRYSFILLYKNILQSRIKICIDFLRNYNINIRQVN